MAAEMHATSVHQLFIHSVMLISLIKPLVMKRLLTEGSIIAAWISKLQLVEHVKFRDICSRYAFEFGQNLLWI